MNREDIIRLMIEADPEMIINIKDHEEGMEGFTGEDPKLLQFWPFKTYVKFAALVAAAEREECAKVVGRYFTTARFDSRHLGLGDVRLTIGDQEEIDAAIRARGEA